MSGQPTDDQTWHWLWSNAARQIILALPAGSDHELISAGYGWGLRVSADRRRSLLLHPSGEGRAAGDLSLTVAGVGTWPIPREGRSYPEYLSVVEAVVREALLQHL